MVMIISRSTLLPVVAALLVCPGVTADDGGAGMTKDLPAWLAYTLITILVMMSGEYVGLLLRCVCCLTVRRGMARLRSSFACLLAYLLTSHVAHHTGLFSGLTLGLLGLDVNGLQVNRPRAQLEPRRHIATKLHYFSVCHGSYQRAKPPVSTLQGSPPSAWYHPSVQPSQYFSTTLH